MELRSLITVIAAGALYLCVEGLRRLLAGGGEMAERLTLAHGASQREELARDLKTPERLLAAFAIVRALALVLEGRAPEPLVKGLGAFATFLGTAALLRLGVTLLLALIRQRGGPDVPRILRSLIDFTLYAIAAGGVLR